MVKKNNMINFIAEDSINKRNFLKYKGDKGFVITPSPFATAYSFANNRQPRSVSKNYSEKSVYAVGVGYSPKSWARQDLFNYIPERIKYRIRTKKVFFMIDQSHEGYHTDFLFRWFHDQCEKHQLPLSQIIYVTGDRDVENRYNKFKQLNNIKEGIHTIAYSHFEQYIYTALEEKESFGKTYQFLTDNTMQIKDFNCLQKRVRLHRVHLFKELVNRQILDKGIISMNKIPDMPKVKFMDDAEVQNLNSLLPMLPENHMRQENVFSSQDCGLFLKELNADIMQKSFLSVISEALFFDSEGDDGSFLSEKSFKPIACKHPFIIVSSHRILEHIRSLGYKTFHPYIDESYDTEPDPWKRIKMIADVIEKFVNKTYDEKLLWFKSVQNICEYNYDRLVINCTTEEKERFVKFEQIVKGN